jgi:hypothetical protein
MEYTYKIIEGLDNVVVRSDGASIPTDPANSDYQTYLVSLEPKAKATKVVDEAAPE